MQRNKGYQIVQSLIAIGSGGPFGLGLGQSRQKFLYLPEPFNDFIFSVVCEELGFIGATLILGLFAFFVYRGFSIARRQEADLALSSQPVLRCSSHFRFC